jgi:ketosteroid isomerase-like protein
MEPPRHSRASSALGVSGRRWSPDPGPARDTDRVVPEEKVEIVRRLIEAWDRGDYSAALDLIDPDIEVNVAYRADLDGTYRGHAGLTEMMGAFWAEFEGPRIEIEEAERAGGAVVVGVRFYGRGKRSGVEIDAPAWHAWRLRGGKAVRWQLFRTKQEALEAAGLSK